MRRLFIALAVPVFLLAAACGDGGADSPAGSAASPAPRADAERFVFGASPGRPVIYWIHTDW